jgi:hypothetical protein
MVGGRGETMIACTCIADPSSDTLSSHTRRITCGKLCVKSAGEEADSVSGWAV